MKTSKGIFWGGLLVILGILWLLRNLDLIDIDWYGILPYWPILLILAGFILLVSGKERGASGGAVGLLITLAVFGAIVNKTDRAFDHSGRDWHFNWNDDDDNDEHNNDYDDDGDQNEDENDDNGQEDSKKQLNGNYQYEMEEFIQKAYLNLEGGAGSFKLEGNTDKLFAANTRSSSVGFISNRTVNKLEGSATVNLKMEEGNVTIKNGKISNEASIQLNERPVWHIDLGIGAGKGDFDFSNYKVESLKVSTGVAEMDVKLGDKQAETNVFVEAGVASVTLEIPESVGCEVRLDGAMNIRSFDDLEKVSDGLYRSPGYDGAAKKVHVKFEGGLSKVRIKRYER
ncbi:LiaF transmembrane domain-containing protein [Dyadobacter helix]|nr:DUF5668 domain-containing protein [Dyadobacter sp. CECT 9275]